MRTQGPETLDRDPCAHRCRVRIGGRRLLCGQIRDGSRVWRRRRTATAAPLRRAGHDPWWRHARGRNRRVCRRRRRGARDADRGDGRALGAGHHPPYNIAQDTSGHPRHPRAALRQRPQRSSRTVGARAVTCMAGGKSASRPGRPRRPRSQVEGSRHVRLSHTDRTTLET